LTIKGFRERLHDNLHAIGGILQTSRDQNTPMQNWKKNVRLLDAAASNENHDVTLELFHRLNRAIPEDQEVLSIPPDCLAREALQQMEMHAYSQLPIISNGTVIGMFTLRSFAKEVGAISLADWNSQKSAPGDLRVDECVESWSFARVQEDISQILDQVRVDGGVLIGSPEQLIAILTPDDLTRYLFEVANPFVLVSEIELAVRQLIVMTLDPTELEKIAQKCLISAYGEASRVPITVEEMTFDNYQKLITYGDAWEKFESVIHGSRTRASSKLKEIASIRNALFHFKRKISLEEHERLSEHRNWLLRKINQVSPVSSSSTGESTYE
jgi:predicted transcriptional regulator